jgi:hypothetical protein
MKKDAVKGLRIVLLMIAAALLISSVQAINTGTLIYFKILSDPAPTVQFTAPTPFNGTYNTTQTINVTANDANLSSIAIYVNGTAVHACGSSPCQYTFPGDGNYTVYAVANDTNGNTNTTETRNIIIDTTPPQIQYASPTPANGTYNTTQTINVTASDTGTGIANITIYVNGSAVKTCSASPCDYTLTGEGNYTFYATAYDNAGNSNTTQTRNIAIDKTYPSIFEASLSPYAIINGSNVSLYVNASGFDYLWATVRRPDGTSENVTLANNTNTIYMNTSLLGIYNVTFYGADIAGNTVTRKDHFEAFRGVLLDLNVTNSSILGINSTFISYYRNGTVALNQSAIGYYVIYIPNTTLDMQFYAHNDSITVTTYNIDIINAVGKYIGLDVHYRESGFLVTYGVSPQWTVTSGKVRIKYDDVNYTNEDNLRLYKCDDFNFTAMNCTGLWNDVTSISTQDKPGDYFEITVTGFSGFSIKEVTPAPPGTGGGGGGGGGGQSTEKECIEDWRCGAWSGCFNGMQTRECTDRNACGTDAYRPYTRMPCSVPCSAHWNCTEWSTCTPAGEQTRECTDDAGCGTRRDMPQTKQGCGYDAYGHCHNRIQDYGEDGIDCGGGCEACMILEKPTIAEYAPANILCELIPLFVLAMFILLLLAAGLKILPKSLKVLSAVNLGLMIVGLILILPAAKFPNGACMAIADQLPIITEILWFLSVTFTITLLEGLAIIYIKRKELLIPPEPPHKREKRGRKAAILLIISASMIIGFSISMIININTIIDRAAEGTNAAESGLMAYMPFVIAMLLLTGILFWMKEPEPPMPPPEQKRLLHRTRQRQEKRRNG